MDIATLAKASLAVNVFIMVTLFVAAYLAKVRRSYGAHCTFMRVAVPLQLLIIASVMLPSLLEYISHRGAEEPFVLVEILIHHTFGLLAVLLWAYINLVFVGVVRSPLRLAILMRLAFVTWTLAFLMGVRFYVIIWV
ncbi:MAG: hypothetical protein HYX92_12840 [Chloroflexi bacterium]|nr:hypothetical protein [Chloroflexota bacterium]